jgi:hypothetical protein
MVNPQAAAHQKRIFVGKLDGELWASEKNDLRAVISAGILSRAGREGFWAVSFRCEQRTTCVL